MVDIKWLGLCSSATMLALYDVNIARVARNVVNIINRPDVVAITSHNVVPCWQTAPITNEMISNDDILPRIIGCINCENIIILMTIVIRMQHFHTSVLCVKDKKLNTNNLFLSVERDFIALQCYMYVICILSQMKITSNINNYKQHHNRFRAVSLPKAR